MFAGCQTSEVMLQSKFDSKEVAYINQGGKGLITGQAFLTRNDGIVVYAAG